MKEIKWQVKQLNASDLKSSEYNPRKISKDQKKHLEDSLENFGLAEPIIVNKNNKIIGGHQRFKILKKKGIKKISVSMPDRLLSDEEEKELNLRLNKNMGEFDFDLLINNFEIPMLDLVGFKEKDLKIDFEPKVGESTEKKITPVFQVLVECKTEGEQEGAYNLLKKHNYKSRIISI